MSDLPTKLQARIDAMLAKNREAVMSEPVVEDVVGGDDVPLSETLPDVSESKRAVPNAILRSSLFGVVGKGHRKYEKNALKATVQGFTVKFTGEQLDQADLDVYLECVRRCASQPLGELVRFTAYEFLQSIGRDSGKTQYDWLQAGLLRLTACAVELGDGRFCYWVSIRLLVCRLPCPFAGHFGKPASECGQKSILRRLGSSWRGSRVWVGSLGVLMR